MTERSYEDINIGDNTEQLFDTCVLKGKIIEIDRANGTADVEFDGGLGRINNIPIHYHCQNMESTALGHLAFIEDDDVLVLAKGQRSFSGTPEYTLVGFASSSPRMCRNYLCIRLQVNGLDPSRVASGHGFGMQICDSEGAPAFQHYHQVQHLYDGTCYSDYQYQNPPTTMRAMFELTDNIQVSEPGEAIFIFRNIDASDLPLDQLYTQFHFWQFEYVDWGGNCEDTSVAPLQQANYPYILMDLRGSSRHLFEYYLVGSPIYPVNWLKHPIPIGSCSVATESVEVEPDIFIDLPVTTINLNVKALQREKIFEPSASYDGYGCRILTQQAASGTDEPYSFVDADGTMETDCTDGSNNFHGQLDRTTSLGSDDQGSKILAGSRGESPSFTTKQVAYDFVLAGDNPPGEVLRNVNVQVDEWSITDRTNI